MKLKERLLAPRQNSSRFYLEQWAGEAGRQGTSKDFRVLDAGAGVAPYRNLFADVTYETADFAKGNKEYGDLDYVCDLTALPMTDGTYDLVFCSQTLEHLPDPVAALKEFYRVLKPGGEAWLSAPLFFEEHEQPFDFFRYTQFAWRKMAEESGFAVRSIEWLEGYYGTVSYQAQMAAHALPKKWVVSRLFLRILSRRLATADQVEKITDRGMCKNYCVVFVKAAGHQSENGW